MAVVVLLFIAVLKQFGILEPMSMEGNAWPSAPLPGSAVFGERAAAERGCAGPGSAALGRPALSGAGRLSRRPLRTPEGWPGTEGMEKPGAPRSPRGVGAAVLGVGVSEMPGDTLSHPRPAGPNCPG